MKIIALLPVKNEAWIIKSYLDSMDKIADGIIALDDGSGDQTLELLCSNPKVEIYNAKEVLPAEKMTDMSARRSFLLNKAREAKATHQIWLDADEVIPPSLSPDLRKVLSTMEQGQRLKMPWITLWKDSKVIRTDGVWKKLYKDFVFCDDGTSAFLSQRLSESRTPVANPSRSNGSATNDGNSLDLECEVPVLHFQFVFWERAKAKQAWYRCHELIQGDRNARRINATYSIADDSKHVVTIATPEKWLHGIRLPEKSELEALSKDAAAAYTSKILEWFDVYGIEYFEGLDIWQIPDLQGAFLERTGRTPRPSKFPYPLVKMNAIRHRVVELFKNQVNSRFLRKLVQLPK